MSRIPAHSTFLFTAAPYSPAFTSTVHVASSLTKHGICYHSGPNGRILFFSFYFLFYPSSHWWPSFPVFVSFMVIQKNDTNNNLNGIITCNQNKRYFFGPHSLDVRKTTLYLQCFKIFFNNIKFFNAVGKRCIEFCSAVNLADTYPYRKEVFYGAQ